MGCSVYDEVLGSRLEEMVVPDNQRERRGAKQGSVVTGEASAPSLPPGGPWGGVRAAITVPPASRLQPQQGRPGLLGPCPPPTPASAVCPCSALSPGGEPARSSPSAPPICQSRPSPAALLGQAVLVARPTSLPAALRPFVPGRRRFCQAGPAVTSPSGSSWSPVNPVDGSSITWFSLGLCPRGSALSTGTAT